MPVDAVSDGGRSSVRSGSHIATAGYRSTPPIATFSFRSSSVNTDHRLTSLPVPAVVGMAMHGSGRFLHLVQADVVERRPRVGGERGHRLGGVERAAAADADDDIGAAGLQGVDALGNQPRP